MTTEVIKKSEGNGLLFSPLTIRNLRLKNRVMVSPMCMYSATDGMPDDFHLVHLGRFALGGAGLVFMEATAVSEEGRITQGCVGLWSNASVPMFRRITTFLHRFGCAAGIQLSHSGDKGSSTRPWEGGASLGPSPGGAWETASVTGAEPGSRALTQEDLHRIRMDFVDAARRADAAGFDVLEIHCAHGYLLHSFLSPISNTRQDQYGGDLEGRMRFPLQVIGAVREAWPPEKPLFVRVSSVDGIDVGWSVSDTVSFARALKALGVDVVDCSSGGMKLPRQQQLVSRTPGFHLPYAREVREAVGIMTVGVGLIRDAAHAEFILAEGDADLVAIAREALFNPNWAAQSGLRLLGGEAWDLWPEQHGWWLKRRAIQQGDSYESLASGPAD